MPVGDVSSQDAFYGSSVKINKNIKQELCHFWAVKSVINPPPLVFFVDTVIGDKNDEP